MVQLLWKRVWEFLKKLKVELPYDPATLLLDIDPQMIEHRASKRYLCTRVHSSITDNS